MQARGGSIAQWLAYLLPDPAAPAFPKTFPGKKLWKLLRLINGTLGEKWTVAWSYWLNPSSTGQWEARTMESLCKPLPFLDLLKLLWTTGYWTELWLSCLVGKYFSEAMLVFSDSEKGNNGVTFFENIFTLILNPARTKIELFSRTHVTVLFHWY